MLKTSRQIAELTTNLDTEVDVVLDQAEQRMLAVADNRVGDGLEKLGDLLSKALVRLEQVETEGLDVTGLPTGLADLDRKLGDLQPSTLVVAAGRPGMGKSALAMNIAQPHSHQPRARGVPQHGNVPHRNRLPLAGFPSPGRLDEATVRTRGKKPLPDMGGSDRHNRPTLQSTPPRRRRTTHRHRHPSQMPGVRGQ